MKASKEIYKINQGKSFVFKDEELTLLFFKLKKKEKKEKKE